MDTNNGPDKLIASIIEDAQKEAQALADQAELEVAAIRERLDLDRERMKDEFAAKAQADREDTIKRAATNAELEGRKELLARKHALMDEAYGEAYKRLLALSGSERAGVLKNLLQKEAEGFETVRPAKADRELVAALIKGTKLTLGEDAEGIDGGFILEGNNFVKDCSFAAMMEEVRAATLERVAKVLFD